MKMRTLLVAAVMFLGLTAAAFAQATFSVGSVPVTTVTATGMTERAGTVTFSHLSGTTLAGTITINYQTAISNPGAGFTDVVVGGTIAGVSLNTVASSHSSGILVVNVPAGAVTGTITVSGVRVRIADTGLANLQALISTTGNAIVAGQSVVTVINATRAGVGTVAVPTFGTINNVTNGVTTTTGTTVTAPAGSATALLAVNEGYLDTWDGARYGSATTSGFVGIRLTFASAPQASMRLVFPDTVSMVDANATATATGGVFVRANSVGTTATGTQRITSASSGSSLQVFYMAQMADPQKLEQVRIPITIESSSSSAVPFAVPASPINVTVSMAPVNTTLLASDGYPISFPIPRYSASESTAVTVVTYEVANTTLLIPFATVITSTGFNTGISVANTTKDPGSAAMGVTTAVAQNGRLTFYIYPQRQGDGTLPDPVIFTPVSALANTTGLDASGLLPSGSTFTALLSDIFTAAGVTASWRNNFNGYVFIVTNFTNAHGQYVLSDFKTFSQGALALVVTSARNATREALDN